MRHNRPAAPKGGMPAIALLIGSTALCLSATQAQAADVNPLLAAVGAPSGLMLRGSLRARIESVEGQFRPGFPASDKLLSTRLILFGEYDFGPIRIGGELRDARGYGEKRGSSTGVNEVNALEPSQAYATLDLDGVAGKGSTGGLTAGRFTMEIGSGRLVGRPDFSNSVNSYTGGRIELKNKAKDQLTAFWVEPSLRGPIEPIAIRHNKLEWDKAQHNLHFFGASVTKAMAANVGLEAFAYRLSESDRPDQLTRNRHLTTYGARLLRPAKAGSFDFEVEAARQTGTTRLSTTATDLRDVSVRAHNVHAEIGRKFDAAWSPRLSLHADQASGDGTNPNRYGRFDTLFGATRTDFGPTGLYGPLTRSNLESAGVRVEVAPSRRLDGFLMTRALWLEEPSDSFAKTSVRDRKALAGRYAGVQAEGRLRYWLIPKRLRIETGAAYLGRGRFLDTAPNAPATGNTKYGYFDIATEF